MVTIESATTSITSRRAGTAAGLLAALTLAACGTSSSGEAAPATEASVSVAPRPSATDVYKLAGKVCNGFFTQKQADGNVLVIGRPVVNERRLPDDVTADAGGIRLIPQEYGEGAVSWYTMRGVKLDEEETVTCKESPLYARELTQPNGMKTWVASTDPDNAIPRTWDAQALKPEGFSGVGLNYGPMSPADFQDVRQMAAGN